MNIARFSRRLAFTALVVLLAACSSKSKPIGPAAGAKFTFGEDVVLVEKEIGPGGGMLVAPAGSPLEGVTVSFPPGALAAPITVGLAYNTGAVQLKAGEPSGKYIVLQTGDVKEFRHPVVISFPRPDSSKLAVPYYVDPSGHLHLVQTATAQGEKGRVTFYTFHASLWTWVEVLWDTASGGPTVKLASKDTGFRPERDGFQIVNYGSRINPNGECSGFAAFSGWYFENHKAEGDFYPQFMEIVDEEEVKGQNLKGQNIIAARAYNSLRQYAYILTWIFEFSLSPAERYATLANAIANTGSPVMVSLTHSPGSGEFFSGHQLLAFAYNNNEMSIYDPNAPGVTKQLIFDKATQKIVPYDNSWDSAWPLSISGTLSLREDFEKILEDARSGFKSYGGATLEVTSHQNHQAVTLGPLLLEGKLTSGRAKLASLTILVRQAAEPFVQRDVTLNADGTFSTRLSIAEGENQLEFVTTNAKGEEVMNTLGRNTFMLVGCPAEGCINCCRPECMLTPAITECLVGGKPCLRCGATEGLTCGDKKCTTPSESCQSCPADCGACPGCGDGTCSPNQGETCFNCAKDCDGCATCGDKSCWEDKGESCRNCPQDCGECPKCGDGSCREGEGETCKTCALDCGECPRCGDKSCREPEGETCSTCPADCGECPKCGDASCWPDIGETCQSCPQDCGECPRCGDKSCNNGETCKTCPQDCGPCTSDAGV